MQCRKSHEELVCSAAASIDYRISGTVAVDVSSRPGRLSEDMGEDKNSAHQMSKDVVTDHHFSREQVHRVSVAA